MALDLPPLELRQDKPQDRTTKQATKLSRALRTSVGVFFVLVLAVGLFLSHERSKGELLRAQYMRSVSSTAERMRIQVENYTRMVKTLDDVVRRVQKVEEDRGAADKQLKEKETAVRTTKANSQGRLTATAKKAAETTKHEEQANVKLAQAEQDFQKVHFEYTQRSAERQKIESDIAALEAELSPPTDAASSPDSEKLDGLKKELNARIAAERAAERAADNAFEAWWSMGDAHREIAEKRKALNEQLAQETVTNQQYTHAIQLLEKESKLLQKQAASDVTMFWPPSYRDKVFLACGVDRVCQVDKAAELTGMQGMRFRACPAPTPPAERIEATVQGTEIIIPFTTGAICGVVSTAQLFKQAKLPTPNPGIPAKVGEADQGFVALMDGSVIASASPTERLQVTNAARMIEQEVPGHAKKSVWSHLIAGTSATRVLLGGEHFELFVQPVLRGTLASEQNLVVLGLVSSKRLQGESQALDPSAIMWVAILVGLALLSIPVAKLWLVGPFARYDRLDVAMLAFAGLLLAVLFLVTGLVAYSEHLLVSKLDERLERIALSAKSALLNQLQITSEALEEVHNEPAWIQPTVPQPAATQHGSSKGKHDHEPVCVEFSWDGTKYCEGVNLRSLVPEPSKLRQLPKNFVFSQLDAKGFQRAKLSAGQHATLPADLGKRDYFIQTSEQKSGKGSTPCKACKPGIADIVWSWTTGEYRLVVNRAANVNSLSSFDLSPQEGSEERSWVLSVATPLESLSSMLLPSSLSVAVITRDGTLLYRSGAPGAATAKPNLFQDVSDPQRLQAALNALQPGNNELVPHSDDLHFRGAPHRLSVAYMPDMDWFIVTLAPRSGIDAMVAHMASMTVAGVTIFLFLGAVVATSMACITLLFPRARSTRRFSLRPRRSQEACYVWSAGWCFVVSAFVCLLSTWPPGGPYGWTLFLLGAGALAPLSGTLVQPPRFLRPPAFAARFASRLTLEGSYALWLLGGVAALVIAPAITFFSGAFDHLVGNSARADMTELVQRLDSEHRQKNLTQNELQKLVEGGWGISLGKSNEAFHEPEESALFEFARFVGGPVASPQREYGYLHLSGFKIPPSEEMIEYPLGDTTPDAVRAALADTKFPVPKLLTFGSKRAWGLLIVWYLLGAIFAIGGVILAVRKVFFTSLLVEYEQTPRRTLRTLPAPVEPRQRIIVASPPGDSARNFRERDLLLKDFRYRILRAQPAAEQGIEWVEPPGAGSSHPILVDASPELLKLQQGRTAIQDALRQASGIVFIQHAQAADPLRALLHKAGANTQELSDDEAGRQIFIPPRFIIKGLPEVEVRQYTDRGYFSQRKTPSDVLSQPASKGILVPDLEAFLADQGAEEALHFLSAAANPVVLVSLRSQPYLDEVQAGTASTLVQLLLKSFIEISSAPRMDLRLSRHSRPSGSYIADLWNTSSEEEKLVLRQLATRKFVVPHPRWITPIKTLAARSVLDPDDLTLNPALAEHVVRQPPREEELLDHPASSWDRFKAPLATAVISICAAFGVSQPQMALGTMLAPSAFAALPGLLRIIVGLGGSDTSNQD